MINVREGLIHTNDKCVGCNKCIGVCSCKGATIAIESADGNNIIKVDGSKCVACGACFDACEHNAREYVDDTRAFFEALEAHEEITVLFAPAFLVNYPDEYRQILGKLKYLGVKRFLSVAFGADITTWAYLKYISENNFIGGISQPCPATVDYIEKYIPELIPKLIPVQSPMMCAAIYARKHLGVTGKIAFIGPCIAKKNEIMSERGKGIISYSVTFNHLMKKLRCMDIEAPSYEGEIEGGLGSIYAMPGGLKENIYWFLGEDAFIRQIDGEKYMYKYLEDNKDRILEGSSYYTLFDLLNCKEGCLCGTGVEEDIIDKEKIYLQIMKVKEKSKNRRSESAWSKDLSHKERLEKLNEQFSALDIEDYICSYTDKSEENKLKEPTEEEIEFVFEDMYKFTDEERVINCSCCGYNSCREMATAIYHGYNHKENCIHFIKDTLEDVSVNYPTVLIIHGKNQSIHVLKYTGEGAIRSWIDSGLGLVDYNTAISKYIEKYVDEADKERILKATDFSTLKKKLEENGSFKITYLRHPENGASGYFELNFSKMKGHDDIVLSFKDVDKEYREAHRHEQELQSALDLANRENEIIKSLSALYFIIYIVDLVEDSFIEVKAPEYISEFVNQYKSARECLNVIPDALFSKIEIDGIREFYNVDNWAEFLSDKDSCNHDGKGRGSGMWNRTTLIAAGRDSMGRPQRVICGVMNIGDEKEREFANYSIINGLSVEFSTLWLINAQDQSMYLVRKNEYATIGDVSNDYKHELVNYDYAMNAFITEYIVEEEKELIREKVRFSTLMDRIPDDDVYTVNFLKHFRDGSCRYTQMVFTKAKNAAGDESIVLAYRDIDTFVREEQLKERELEAALEEARKANNAKSSFLANMSHEIRTPINAILGMDTMILRESNQENVIEYAKNVKSASNTLLSLINDILDFSKIESGKMDIIDGKYRLDSVINDLVNMVRGKAEEKNLTFEVNVQDQIPSQLYGDEVRVKQVILNILNNAVKYTQKGKVCFEIGYEQINDGEINLCVFVKDTGIGIKKEDMSILFSPYERLEENKNKLIEGTGLGLSITRNLLEKMGSSLIVESVYGEGSVFSFKVKQGLWGDEKISQNQVFNANNNIENEQCEKFHAPNAKLLVVDDVEMNITVLEGLLKRIQIRPDRCLSGKEAIELAAKNKYDIIFMDAMMPGMSGEETFHEIRKSCPLNADTPIVVLTANAIMGAMEQYIAEGFTDYLSKPVDGSKLEAVIQKYLPEDKIVEVTGDISKPLSEDISEKEIILLGRIDYIKGVNTKDGIEAAADVTTYFNVCKSFADTYESRSSMIKDYYREGNIKDYTIQVHALKSSARLVGALELSSLAFEMEKAGREDNWETIQENTEDLLNKYKVIAEALAGIFGENEDKKVQKELPLKKFMKRIADLEELVEAYDFDTARELYNKLKEYRLPEKEEKLVKKLKAGFAEADRKTILDIIATFKKGE